MSTDLAFHVLLALAVVVIEGHILGRLLAAAGHPPVIGEVLSGILLGPSLLGRLAPGAEHYLFPDSARPALGVVAQLGIVLYMFVVGLEFIMALMTTAMTAPLQAALAAPVNRCQH